MNSTNLKPESRETIAGHLNDLIAICNDGSAGFRKAADKTESPELRALFVRLSRQRIDFAEELRQALSCICCESRDGGDIPGKLHRGWVEIKSTFVGNDAPSVLNECERGEDAAVKAYQNALKNCPLDSACRILVATQASAVQASHDHIRVLRDHPAYA